MTTGAARSDEIGEILRARIADFDAKVVEANEGIVASVGDGIASIYGLDGAMASEVLNFGNGIFGLALDLREDGVGAAILGPSENIHEGTLVRTTGRQMEVPVGDGLLGRILDPLGNALDGRGPIESNERLPIERPAPGVIERSRVDTPLQTGIKAIDTMIPIGHGQRELIIGDRQTGKTAVAIDTIINQKGTGTVCIYVAIGQRSATVAQVADILRRHDALAHTVIVAATAANAAALQYIAPFSGCAIGEYVMEKGGKALVVYDDLSKHADAYRQLSLLLRRPPSREAYPGDVFYLHSRLLERAARLSPERGGGSLTALPVIETKANDVSAFIPTNVISITDGQIFLETDLFNAGVRPAINVGLSVSRVGGDAQTKAMKGKKVAGSLRLELAQYRELAAFVQFSADLDRRTKERIDRGQRMTELLKQPQYRPLTMAQQVAAIYSGTQGFLDDVAVEQVLPFSEALIRFLQDKHSDLLARIDSEKVLSDELDKELADAISEFKRGYAG